MALTDNAPQNGLKILGQIELPEIKQENKSLQGKGSAVSVLPNGSYQLDLTQKWQIGAVIFYDSVVNSFGMIAVKAKKGRTYRFTSDVKRGRLPIDRGDLVVFLAVGNMVKDLVPIRSVSNLPWSMILRHINFYEVIEFDYNISKYSGSKGHMSVPVIKGCVSVMKSSDEENFLAELYKKLQSFENDELKEAYLKKILPLGIQTFFVKKCLNQEYAASLLNEDSPYLAEYHYVVLAILNGSIEKGDLSTASKIFTSFSGLEKAYDAFLSALNDKSSDWNVLTAQIKAFQTEDDGNDFFLDILQSELDVKPAPNVLLASAAIKRTPEYAVLLKRANPDGFSKEFVVQAIQAERSVEGKEAVLEILPDDLSCEIVTESFAGSVLERRYLTSRWKRDSKLNFASFDIESDGKQIFQAAVISEKGEIIEDPQSNDLFPIINAIRNAEVLIGHNIKEWDIPILNNKGLSVSESQFIWDTMEMEIILEPARYSYALETAHTASEDAKLSLKLFWNQVYRIVDGGERYSHVREILPNSLQDFIKRVSLEEYRVFLREASAETTSFFRERTELDPTLKKKLSEISGHSLILAPQDLWPIIASQVDASFPTAKGNQYLSVSSSAVEDDGSLSLLCKTILRTFIKSVSNPLVIKLSGAARRIITDEKISACLVDSGAGDGLICTDTFGVEELGDLSSIGITDIYSTGYEIESRMNRTPVGEPFCAADLLKSPYGAKLLMQLSGATVVPIGKADCSMLHLPKLPEDVQNVWMHKDEKGLFQVYCNRNYTEYISCLSARFPSVSQHQIGWVFSDSKESHLSIIATRRNPHFDARMKRVNPTSLYRSMYWAYQFGLIEGIPSSSVKVLYVSNQAETEAVRRYAESLGYYSPANDITVQRRIELCANHTTNRRIVIIGDSDFRKLRQAKISLPICLVWDNLDTDSLQVMWRGLIPFGDEPEYGAESNEPVDEIPSALSCILAAWPMVKYYYHQLARQNPFNEICMLDPSFDDYRELEKTFLASRHEVTLWQDEESYKETVKNAQQFFAGAKREEDLDIDFEHAKETIRQIMLDPKVANPPAQWTPIQEKALPQVFNRRSHSLISIPTGGGKSVLFQGPALYRAAFTNRLSIVITPLKALMQDQVNGLHELGFLTNVEYLNSDKSRPETSRVYRKVTGGEIALLYVTPERFRSRGFRNALESRMEADSGLEYIIFDEAHCISQWGLDFRPEYLSTAQTCAKMAERFPDSRIELFSATVTGQVRDDIESFISPLTGIGTDEAYNPVRNHIGMEFTVTDDLTEGRATLLFHKIEESGFNPSISRVLVFSRTRKMTEEVCTLLSEKLKSSSLYASLADKVGYSHAGMDAEDRSEAFDKFRDGEFVILIATKAFGMGMDIPNIHFIYHLSPPQFIEDYLQEVGRAGRSREMYERAGFNPDHPIPTQCFVSVEDFRNLRTLLAQGMLNWEDVRSIYVAVRDFVEKFQPEGAEQTVPIAVPDNIWKKETANGAVADPTAFRLGLYWLEKMQRITMGYYASTTIDLALHDSGKRPPIRDEKLSAVYDFVLKEAAKWKNPDNVQIYINEICSQLSIGQNSLFRYIIQGSRSGLFSVINRTAFTLTKLRTDEVHYCIENRAPLFVINVVFEATRLLLSSMEVRKSTLVDIQKRNAILEEALASSGVIEATDENQNREHMPWYKPNGTGISTKKTYVKDLSMKRAKYMFTIVDMLPGTTVKSQIDDKKRQVVQEVYVSSGRWNDHLSKMKEDCIKLAKYLAERFFRNERDFVWTEAISELRLPDDYQYLCDLISILRMLGFINADGILSTGIEINLTDNRKEIPESIGEDQAEVHIDPLDKDIMDDFSEVNFLKELKFSLMDTFRDIPKERFPEFIQAYFSCKTREDYMRVMGQYNEEGSDRMKALQKVAIKTQEDRLDDMQRAIYQESIDEDINVIAGPGSGKTHVLTLRCAKLVYHHKVLPQNILVLAYNRAVVEELKTRLSRLFNELGYGRSMSQLQIYTFHGLARKYCYDQIKDKPMEEWESTFLSYITSPRTKGVFRAAMGNVQYILIDEFQDITQTRLELMLQMRKLLKRDNTEPRFFTIGDINQSIYGFDKLKQGYPMDPQYYYDELRKSINPKEMWMTTNYRSYQGILDAAFKFIPGDDKRLLPHSSEKIVAPEEQYVFIKDSASWFQEFPSLIQQFKFTNDKEEDATKRILSVAVFFRSNAEVYRGYSHLKKMMLGDVRIRIQGASGEFFRTRECYSLISSLRRNPDAVVKEDMKDKVKAFLDGQRSQYPNWDSYYLDLTYALALDYLSVTAPGSTLYSDMADYLEDIGERDDGQLSKILQNHRSEFPHFGEKIEIILTTMHKVKGLEFDAVVITPSYQPLGYDRDGNLEEHWQDLIGEERRLYYVAYTRAKKRLYAYRYPRELKVEASACYWPSVQLQQKLGHSFDQGLDKFNMSFTVSNFAVNEMIRSRISKNDNVYLQRNRFGDGWNVMYVDKTNGQIRQIGALSKGENWYVNRACQGVSRIDGLFVSDVYVWRYEDTLRTDKAKNTTYASQWTQEAIQYGSVLIVDIAGYTSVL